MVQMIFDMTKGGFLMATKWPYYICTCRNICSQSHVWDQAQVYQCIQRRKTFGNKDSFLRALREVVPEIELFMENHGQYIKKFAIKLIYIQSCTIRHFTKKLYLEEYV